MKKLVPFILVGILILSGFGAADIINDEPESVVKKIEMITFSEKLILREKDEYLTVEIEGTDSLLTEAGEPMLPVYRKTFAFSSAAKIKGIACDYSEVKEKSITKKVIPAPEVVPRCYPNNVDRKPLLKEDEEIYRSNALFPGNWYDYSIRCGLNSKGVSTTFVTVEVYPVQYAPTENMLYYVSDVEIRVAYDDPGVDATSAGLESYDMVIIAPEDFSELLQPLINHKNDHGLNTFLKTTEEIYSEYTGRDKPEQIKYFIKDAKETMNITYVLLVGGLKSYIYAKDKDDRNQGSTDWHLPVRYTNIPASDEIGVISDLYYSDLYKYDESSGEWEFGDWDSNKDDIFASGNDALDLVPDVYVGRLACRNKVEVKIVVDKIINYESTSSDEKPWFRRMVGVAGKTFGFVNGVDQNQLYGVDHVDIYDFEWQEFAPSKERLARVEVKIAQWYGGSPNLKLSIEKPLGTVLTFKELPASEIPSESYGFVSFDVPDVYLVSGEKYYITLTAPLGSEYSWACSETDDRYPQGNSSGGTGHDWCFRTFDLPEDGEQPDAEYDVDAAFNYMGDLVDDPVRVYATNRDTGGLSLTTEDIITAISQGAGYVLFQGHGNPLSWNTIWHDGVYPVDWAEGISIYDFGKLSNGEKLPIILVGGCHNGLFNVTLIKTLLSNRINNDHWYWTHGSPAPVCFSWGLCVLPQGGAIASTGCTGYGYADNSVMEVNFFHQIGQGGSTTLGSAHSGSIRKFINENTIGSSERFCIVEYQLFGDPSLKLGGYE